MKIPISLLMACFCMATFSAPAQVGHSQFQGFPADYTASPKDKAGIRIMFYNLENLFDPENDSLKNDDSFTPSGMHHWTYTRYREKLEKTYKVISSVGGWKPPGIIGFCELENRKVIHELLTTTPLARFNYQIIHEESGDSRGIDVALVYRSDVFRPFTHVAHKVVFPEDPQAATRDILMVGGIVNGKDSLFVFVNHWPSKYGGAKETEPRRMHTGRFLRQLCDSLMRVHPKAGLLLMGDFNDEPNEPSMIEGLKALAYEGGMPQKNTLYNLMLRFKAGGTHKFQSHWSIIDQFVVNPNLLDTNAAVYLKPGDARIFKADFLIEPDDTHLGDKPARTYLGMKYLGGFSDHLPIYLDIWFK